MGSGVKTCAVNLIVYDIVYTLNINYHVLTLEPFL